MGSHQTNRGFLYQYLKTLEVWLNNYILGDNCEVYCEIEDDIKVIDESLNRLKFSQIKCYSTSFNLNDEDIEKSIYNFFILFSIYKSNYGSTFIFETNSTISKSDNLLKEWVSKQTVLADDLLEKCIIKIQSILSKILHGEVESSLKKLNKKINEREKKIVEKNSKSAVYEEEIVNFKIEIDEAKNREKQLLIEINDRENLTNFVKRIRWQFENIESVKAIESLKEKNLQLIRKISSIGGAPNTMLGRLLTVIYEKSSESSVKERCLNNDLLTAVITESEEEMVKNSNGTIIALLNDRFDNLENKITEGFDRLESKFEGVKMEVPVIAAYMLPHFEKEEIDNHLEKEDIINQSNLERKVKQIGIKGEHDENYLIDLATEIRCSYLIHMEKLKLENLMNEYGNMRILERKVRDACINAVQNLETVENFNSYEFWIEFKCILRDLAKNYGQLKSIIIDDDVVFAQMYQLAAECPLRWNRVEE